jgi:cold shock CspA family protein
MVSFEVMHNSRFKYKAQNLVAAFPDDRYVGIVKHVNETLGHSFIHSQELQVHFRRDVFVGAKQLGHYSKGDLVSFSLTMDHVGRPQAKRLQAEPNLAPSMNVIHVETQPRHNHYSAPLSPQDLITVPEVCCLHHERALYARLREEVTWVRRFGTYYQGHNIQESGTCQQIIRQACRFFDIEFFAAHVNLYEDGSDIRFFHRDAHHHNNALPQNCTCLASFGETRGLHFRHAASEETKEFLLRNGSLLFFGRSVNSAWLHGVPRGDQALGGRISVSIWGTVVYR